MRLDLSLLIMQSIMSDPNILAIQASPPDTGESYPAVGTSTIHFLRQPADRPQHQLSPERGTAPSEEKAPQEEAYILCRDCLHPITRPADRITVQGQHRHTFANPHGIVFEIGCFRSAPGCGAIGPASDEFTWFAGHHWRVCVCAACLVHLGWRFTSTGGSIFFGLILDRLIEPT
jgi:hypothetical protein